MPESTQVPARAASRLSVSLRYGISALVTLALLYFAFRGTDLDKLLDAVASANYAWVLVSFATLLASHVARAWRWRFLMDPIKPGIGLRNLFSGVMIGYLINNVIPRGGEIARPYALGKLEGVSKTAAFGTVVVERILDTFSFLILVALIPVLYHGPLLETFPWLNTTGIVMSLVTGALLLALVVFMVRRDWTDALLRSLGPLLPGRWASRIGGMVHSFLDGLLFLKNPRQTAAILLLSALVWLLYALMYYLSFFAFHLEGTLDFSAAVVILAIASIGFVIPTPGGMGSYHAITSTALARLFLVDPAVALSFATVSHAVSYIGVSVIGAYYLFRDNVKISEAIGPGREG